MANKCPHTMIQVLPEIYHHNAQLKRARNGREISPFRPLDPNNASLATCQFPAPAAADTPGQQSASKWMPTCAETANGGPVVPLCIPLCI